MDTQRIQELQRRFDMRHRGRRPFYSRVSDASIADLEHLVVCIAGEVGEFANLTKKVSRGDLTIYRASKRLSEEIADVFIYTIKICNALGIDLGKAYVSKMRRNSVRFKKFQK